ncbi:MAG: urease accessory protein UreD [Pseudomonadota bacterium]
MNDLSPITEATPTFQRTKGHGRIASKRGVDGKSRIDRLYQEGAARIRVPDHLGRSDLEAVIINTAGGLTGGDHLTWAARAGQGSELTVTTQACEKVYKSSGGPASVHVDLKVETGARLNWLPQETIFFDQSRLHRTITAEVEEGASLLLVEPVIFGRRAMAETVKTGAWRDQWRIHHKGALIHAENVRLEGAIAEHLAGPAALSGRTALATVLLIGNHAESKVTEVRAMLEASQKTIGGASSWEHAGVTKLVVRLASIDGYTLRQDLIPLVGYLASAPGEGGGRFIPKVWSL